jgi:GWxTD domain-containing protein
MKMKNNVLWFKLAVLVFFILCVPFRANPQNQPSADIKAQEPRSFRMGLDYACFRDMADTTRDYVETYYSFNRRELKFVAEEQEFVAILLMRLSIVDELGNEVESRTWNTGAKVKDENTAKNTDYMITDAVGVTLKPGNYKITLQARDVNSMSSGEATLQAEVKKFSTDKLQLSDLELALNIETDTVAGHLTKAGKRILPNPYRVFTHKGGMVYFYAELYNLANAPPDKPEYVLNFTVLDNSGKKVKDFGEQTQTKPGSSAVVMSGINIATLDSGRYLLRVEAKDKETGQRAFSTKKFVVLREKTEQELIADEVKRFKQDVVYIASPGEMDIFDQLNLSGKQNYMTEFWRKRDPNPETPENEFKIEHYQRINYADLHFSRTSDSNDGWNTDMGRVYIIYGEPDEIERHPSTPESKPWEQWNYHKLQGGGYFIFVDEDGYGVYRLVHSNVKGEVQNQQWEDRIKSGASME